MTADLASLIDALTRQPTEPRSQPIPTGQAAPFVVYGYFDGDRCLYVGQTSDLVARNNSHRSQSPWFVYATEVRVLRTADTRAEAQAAERAAVLEYAPDRNVNLTNRPRTK